MDTGQGSRDARARIICAALMMVAAVSLVGCSANSSPFNEPRTDGDELSSSVVTASIDRDSTRLVGQYGDFTFYAAKALNPADGTCVVVVKEGLRSLEGCGAAPMFEITVPEIGIRYYAESLSNRSEDGWITISPNVLMRDEE